MKTINGFFTYPEKLKDCNQEELEDLHHNFWQVKTDCFPGVYIRQCKIKGLNAEQGKALMMSIWRKHHVVRATPVVKVAPTVNLAAKKTVKKVWRNRSYQSWMILFIFVLSLATAFLIFVGMNEVWGEPVTPFLGDVIKVRVSPVTFTEQELKSFLEPTKAEAKTEPKVLGESTSDKDALIEKILDHIHMHESTNGTNNNPNALHNICKRKGLKNEYGYGGMAHKWCFEDDRGTVKKALINEYWDQFNGNAKMILCHYNIGGKHTDCDYVADWK